MEQVPVMPRRSLRLAVLIAASLAALTACAPAATPATSATPTAADSTPVAAASPSPTPTGAPLTADTVLQVTATATASNGAVLNLTATVLRARLYNDPVAVPRAAATVKRCVGEIDNTVIVPGKWTFGEVDYTATLAPGSPAWPSDLKMLLAPWTNNGATRASSGAVHQVEYVLPGPASYEPNCVQRAFLDGPGSGAVYLGYQADSAANPPYSGWSKEGYGFDFNLPKKLANPAAITVSDCQSVITPLGDATGAPNAAWVTTSSAIQCVVGDPEPQNKPHT
jgi:hypothetical protein